MHVCTMHVKNGDKQTNERTNGKLNSRSRISIYLCQFNILTRVNLRLCSPQPIQPIQNILCQYIFVNIRIYQYICVNSMYWQESIWDGAHSRAIQPIQNHPRRSNGVQSAQGPAIKDSRPSWLNQTACLCSNCKNILGYLSQSTKAHSQNSANHKRSKR